MLLTSLNGRFIGVMLGLALTIPGQAADTTVQYLSGTDKDNLVDWTFSVDNGSSNGSVIPVPSCWEAEGWGIPTYKSYDPANGVTGTYEYNFTVPSDWDGKEVRIVFEAVATDATVYINNTELGSHQGGFYKFAFDIEPLLNFGGSNDLRVVVSDTSSNESVNLSEREGDYWNWSGIHRPVYLEARPAEHIDQIAVDAKADGSLSVTAELDGISSADSVQVQVQTLSGTDLGSPMSVSIASGDTSALISGSVSDITPWDTEHPQLYQLVVTLEQGGGVLHRHTERIGFRTIEVRSDDGIYLNGSQIKMRGLNRHTFWPTTGRTTSRQVSEDDIALLKQMNGNAIRSSHYPPEEHFLEVCDEQGILVIDELAGWQAHYDTNVGEILVRSMVENNRNHPCVILWANGNEGGHNEDLDDDYGLFDPQGRAVLHPGGRNDGIKCDHYRSYDTHVNLAAGSTIYMPTEIIHGLYDGGMGSGLADYWEVSWADPTGGGLFLWAMLDEGWDRDGSIDTNGNKAPDGVLGPYREKEGSFDTLRKVWCPVHIAMDELPSAFDGSIDLENRFYYTNLDTCTFDWRILDASQPDDADAELLSVASGNLNGPDVVPGADGSISIPLPSGWQNHDLLELSATDGNGDVLYTWRWSIRDPATIASKLLGSTSGTVTASEDTTAGTITLSAANTSLVVDSSTGYLSSLEHDGTAVSLSNGPRPVNDVTVTLSGISLSQDGDDQLITASYSEGLDEIVWRMRPDGWIQVHYSFTRSGDYSYYGVGFDYPEANVSSLRGFMQGPYRVWKNRLDGQELNVFDKAYNATRTARELWIYPEFRGYHGRMRWAKLSTNERPLYLLAEQEDTFLQLFDGKNRFENYPDSDTDIAILQGIPGVGSKLTGVTNTGPSSQVYSLSGQYSGSFALHVGDPGLVSDPAAAVPQCYVP